MKSGERGDRRAFNSFAWPFVVLGIAATAVTVSTLHAQGGPQKTAQQSSNSALPPQASPVAQAKHVELEGELEVQFEDSVKGSRLLHFLKTGDKRLKLDFGGQAPGHLLSGSTVHVSGDLQGDTLALGSGGSVQVMALPTTNTFGPQRTLVLLVNFSDNQSTPYDTTSAWGTTFQTTSDFYMENSYGQTSLTGDVFGWYTIPMSSATCDTTQIATLAEQAATANGVNVASYPRRIYAFPQIASCVWWGLGTVGGNPAQAWINGTYTLKVVAHEWGHGLGLYHSHSQPCDPTGCTSVEYGDDHDVMGNPSADHFNAFQKERLGWLNYGESPAITTVTASGSYTLDPYETMSSGPKALKILKSTDASGYRTWYYVEARTTTGFDSDMPPGVIVHTGYEADGNSSFEFDLTPATSGATWMLTPGQTYTDPALNMSITTVYADGTGAGVNVSIVGAPCVAGTPTVSLSGGSSMVTPGVPASYSVAVKNTDGPTCGPTNFGLQDVVPSGWTAGFSQSPIALNAGASATTTLTMTAPAGASGTYGFSVASMRLNTSGANGSTSSSVTVAGPCVSGVPTLSLSPGGPVQTVPGVPVSYTLAVKNNDGSTCAPTTFALNSAVPAGWNATVGQTSLGLTPGQSASTVITLTPPTGATGSYSFSVSSTRTNSTGPTASATGSVTVVSTLGVTVSVGKTGGGYQLSATVLAGSQGLKNAAVKFTVTDPKGNVSTFSATTSSTGVASVKDGLKNNAPKGTYQMQVTVTCGGLTGTASGSFVVS